MTPKGTYFNAIVVFPMFFLMFVRFLLNALWLTQCMEVYLKAQMCRKDLNHDRSQIGRRDISEIHGNINLIFCQVAKKVSKEYLEIKSAKNCVKTFF